MKLDDENQRNVLLELLARCHRAPEEVVVVERLRKAVAEAGIDRVVARDIVTEE